MNWNESPYSDNGRDLVFSGYVSPNYGPSPASTLTDLYYETKY